VLGAIGAACARAGGWRLGAQAAIAATSATLTIIPTPRPSRDTPSTPISLSDTLVWRRVTCVDSTHAEMPARALSTNAAAGAFNRPQALLPVRDVGSNQLGSCNLFGVSAYQPNRLIVCR